MIKNFTNLQQLQPQGQYQTCPSCSGSNGLVIILFCGHQICSGCVDSKILSSEEEGQTNDHNFVLIECGSCDAVTQVRNVSELYLNIDQGTKKEEPSVLVNNQSKINDLKTTNPQQGRHPNNYLPETVEGYSQYQTVSPVSNMETHHQRKDFQSLGSPEDKNTRRPKSVLRENPETEITIFQTLKAQIEEANICSEHNEEISLFCAAENKLCCVSCIYQNQTHQKKRNALPIKQAIGLLKEDNQNFQSACREKTLDIEEALRNCQANKMKLSQAITAYRFALQAEFQKIQQQLEKRLEESMKHIQNYFDKANKECEDKQESLQFLKNCMKEYSDLEKAPEAMYQQTVVYLFSISNMLKNAMKNFTIKTPAKKWENLDIVDMANRQIIQAEISMLGRPRNKPSVGQNSQAAQNVSPQPLTPSSKSSNKPTNRSRSPYQSQPYFSSQLKLPQYLGNSNLKKNTGFTVSRTPSAASESKDGTSRRSFPSRSLHSRDSEFPINRRSCQPQQQQQQQQELDLSANRNQTQMNYPKQLLSPRQEVLSEITQQIEQNILPYFSTVSSNRTANRDQFHSINSPRTLDVSRDSSLPTARTPQSTQFKTAEQILNYSSLISPKQLQRTFQLSQQSQQQQGQKQQYNDGQENQILHSFSSKPNEIQNNDPKSNVSEVIIRAHTLSDQPLIFNGNSFAARGNLSVKNQQDQEKLINNTNNHADNRNNYINNQKQLTQINNSQFPLVQSKKPIQKMISSSFIKNTHNECLFVSSSSGEGGAAATDSTATHQIISGGSSTNGNLAFSSQEASQVNHLVPQIVNGFVKQFTGSQNNLKCLKDQQNQENFIYEQNKMKSEIHKQQQAILEKNQSLFTQGQGKNQNVPISQIQQEEQLKKYEQQCNQEIEKNLHEGNKNMKSGQQIAYEQDTNEQDDEEIGLIQSQVLENKDVEYEPNINPNQYFSEKCQNQQQQCKQQHQQHLQQYISAIHQESFCRFEVSCSSSSQKNEDQAINFLEPLCQQPPNTQSLDDSISDQNIMYSRSIILTKQIMKNEEQLKILPESVKNTKLLYRLSLDGASSQVFHNKCDGQGPTLTLIKANGDHIFGYFMPIPFMKSDSYSTSDKCYIFTLQNSLGIPPTRFNIKVEKKFIAIYQNSKNPCLGSTLNQKQDLLINFDSPEKSCSNLGYAFKIDQGIPGDQILAGAYTDWVVEDIEVFALEF